MLPGKRPLSSNEDRKRYRHEGATPANTPRKFRFIQRNESLLSAEKHEPLNTDSNSSLQTRIQSFGKRNFQKEVIQALLKKIPDDNRTSNYYSPQCIDLRNDVSNITETTHFQSPIRTYLESNEVSSLELNSHNLSENLSEMEYATDSSFNDNLSIIATCSSESSNYDSMSDFENSSDDENCKILQSMSLDDRKSTSSLYLASTFDEFKRRKSASSDNVQDIPSNYPDFEL